MKCATVVLVTLWVIAEMLSIRAQTVETHTFPDLNQAIPDGNAAGLSDVRTLNSAIVNVSRVRVSLRIDGEFNGDLYVYLRHIQSGDTNLTILLNRVGRTAANAAGYADAGLDVVFDDAAADGDIHNYAGAVTLDPGEALTGSWQPDGRWVDPGQVLDTSPRTALLSQFAGNEGSGEWTLYLADIEAGGTHALISWSLEFTGIASPLLSWATPADIVYGTGLSAAQLNATATHSGSPVPGTFTYTPPIGTVLDSGDGQALNVVFTPDDPLTYDTANKTVFINVTKAPLTVTANDAARVYGAPNPVFTGTIAGILNNDAITADYTSPANSSSAVGAYDINPAVVGAAAANYNVVLTKGTLTITPASTAALLVSSSNPAPPGQSVTFTATIGAVAPSTATPTGSVQFKIDGVAVGPPVALVNGVAAYSTSSLSHNSAHSVEAVYAGPPNFLGSTAVLAPLQVINTPPVAAQDTIWRSGNRAVKVSIASLLSNDSDADGDPLSFEEVHLDSPDHGVLVLNGNWIYYTPEPGFTGPDAFTYTISDGIGTPVAGLVNVEVYLDNEPSLNMTVTDLGNGVYEVAGDGVPGRTYQVEFTVGLEPANWQWLGTTTANIYGAFSVLDPAGAPSRSYRSVCP